MIDVATLFRNHTLDQDHTREQWATILERVATAGLPGPRDLDVALDAMFCASVVEDDPMFGISGCSNDSDDHSG